MGTGRPSWLVVLGPCRRWWVVLVPRHQLWVVVLGPCHFSQVEWLGTGHIVRGWWWCALVALFVNGGGGAPSSVFVRHGRRHCRGGLVIARGRGWWVVCVCRHSIRPCWHPASFVCVVVVYPRSHVSSSLSHVPCHCCVSSPCHCPLPSSLLSCDVVVAVPSL